MAPLHEAAKNGDVARIGSLIAAGHDVNERDNHHTPLHRAACYGQLAAVVALIGAGAEVDARNLYRSTPLHIAAQNGRSRIVSVLIAAGADVLAESSDVRTVWRRAHLHNSMKLIETRRILNLLLRAGVPFDDSELDRFGGGPARAFLESIKAAGGWDNYIVKHRAVLKSIVSKCAPVPDDCLLAIAAFVAPAGGW